MNKKLLLALIIFGFIAVQYFLSLEDDDDSDEPGWREQLLDFLKMLGIMMGTDLVVRGLVTLIKKQIAKRAEKAAAKKAAAEAAKHAGEHAGENAGEHAGENAGEHAGENAGEHAGESAGEHAGENAGEHAGESAGEHAGESAGEHAGEHAGGSAAEHAGVSAAEHAAALALVNNSQAALLRLSERELAAKGLAKVGDKVVMKIAEKAAIKASGVLAKIAGGPVEWIVFAISQTLFLSLGLDSGMFDECPAGSWSFTHLPSEALMVIQAVPILGDLWSLIAELVCFKIGDCPPGMENSGGMCYTPCREGYKNDGATFCYKQYGDYWENKKFPAAPTVTSLTQTILTNTGKPPGECPNGKHLQAGVCHQDPPPGYIDVAGVAWKQAVRVGDGRPASKLGCYDFQVREGWDNSRDDGTSCWEDAHLTGGGCHAAHWYDPTSYYCDPVVSKGCGCIKKTLKERSGCNSNEDQINILGEFPRCYPKCPAGMYHDPAAPYNCIVGGPDGIPLGFDMPKCRADQTEDSPGLCYDKVESPFVKTTLGMKSDVCPDGTTPFGVGCTRQSYNRGAGKAAAFTVKMKKRNNYWGIPAKDLPTGF